MGTLALSLANTGRSCGRQMAATAGRFKPVVQHKLCGRCPSQMQIMEPLLVKAARPLEPQTEGLIKLPKRAERLFNFVEFRSLMQIMERLRATAARFLGPLTVEIAGSLNQAAPRICYLVFPLLMRIREQPWADRAESVEKAPFSEQPMEDNTGLARQTRERCVFSKFRLPM